MPLVSFLDADPDKVPKFDSYSSQETSSLGGGGGGGRGGGGGKQGRSRGGDKLSDKELKILRLAY